MKTKIKRCFWLTLLILVDPNGLAKAVNYGKQEDSVQAITPYGTLTTGGVK